MIYFTAHTFKCVCHCRWAMFRVLGMYNFAYSVRLSDNKISEEKTIRNANVGGFVYDKHSDCSMY